MVLPDIVPGIEGIGFTDTPKLRFELTPQELLAVTDTVPPLDPTETLMELLVEDPDHPDGSDHE